MVKLRDHYFISWLAVMKGISYNINKYNEIEVDMTPQEYSAHLDEYKQGMKPVLSKIRELVRELNQAKNS